MQYLGGLFEGTEMLSYSPVNREVTHKLQIDHTGIDDHNMVALFNLFLDYGTRFTPSYLTVKAVSKHAVRLTFEDGYTVTCSKFQNFFMGDYTWKPAKDLTPDDTFVQVVRDPREFEFRGDFCSDDKDFEQPYVPKDIKRIKLKSSEPLPDNRGYVFAVPIDWHSDAIVLANGAVIEGIRLLGHPKQRLQFDARDESVLLLKKNSD